MSVSTPSKPGELASAFGGVARQGFDFVKEGLGSQIGVFIAALIGLRLFMGGDDGGASGLMRLVVAAAIPWLANTIKPGLLTPVTDTFKGAFNNARSHVQGFGNYVTQGPLRHVLNAIITTESGGNFDIVAEGVGAPIIANGKKASQCTIGEVVAWQKQMRRQSNNKSYAIGLVQFIPETLARDAQLAGLSMNDKFSPENQIKMAIAEMNDKGMMAFLEGRLDESTIAKRLSGVWAVLAGRPDGTAALGGIGSNPVQAAVGWNTLIDYLRKAREEYRASGGAPLTHALSFGPA